MVKTCETAIFHGPKVAVDEIPRYAPLFPHKKNNYIIEYTIWLFNIAMENHHY